MLNQLFPKQIDNTFQGNSLALWLLAPLVFVKAVMGVNILFNTEHVIVTADGLPLATFAVLPAAIIVTNFKVWALNQLILALLGGLALMRYRAMTPLVFLAFILESAGRQVIWMVDPLPIERSADGPSIGYWINIAFSTVLIVGFVLSLWRRAPAQRRM